MAVSFIFYKFSPLSRVTFSVSDLTESELTEILRNCAPTNDESTITNEKVGSSIPGCCSLHGKCAWARY